MRGPERTHSRLLDHVLTPVTKDALHAVPHVHLGRNDDVGVQLKPNEARRLGEALSDVAALGEK